MQSNATEHAAPPCVVITGANGFIGSEVVGVFAGQGWRVHALVRESAKFQNTKNVTYFEYDLLAGVPNAAFTGADYLVHTAYIQGKPGSGTADPNVAGAKRLLACSRKYQLKKNVFLSSMSAGANAVSAYGRQKAAIETLFNRANDVSLRCGLVLGNGGLVKRIVEFMRSKHVAPLIDGGEQPLQVVGIYDLARIIAQALTLDVNGTLAIGTPEVYTYREFYLTIRRKLGIRTMLVPVPFWVPLYAIRTVRALRLPLHINEDNLWGLKKLRAFETLPDLAKLNVTIDNLETILSKPGCIE